MHYLRLWLVRWHGHARGGLGDDRREREGGIRGGQVVGATDPIGLRAVDSPYHFRDIHTTILHQLGLDQDKLTYPHLGRNERLTLVQGRVIHEIV